MKKNGRIEIAILLIVALLIGRKSFEMPENARAATAEQSQSYSSTDGKTGMKIIADKSTVKVGDVITFFVYSNGNERLRLIDSEIVFNQNYFELIDSGSFQSCIVTNGESSVTIMGSYFASNKGEKIAYIQCMVKKAFKKETFVFKGVEYVLATGESVFSDEEYTFQFQYSASANDPAFSTHLVKFHSNGGENVETQAVYDGEKAFYPTPTKRNAFFVGWYTDMSLTKLFPFDKPITEDVDLYAKWEDSETQEQSYKFSGGIFGARIIADRTRVTVGDEITFTVYSNGSKSYVYFDTLLEYNSDYFEISRHFPALKVWESHLPGLDKDEWNVGNEGDRDGDSILLGGKIGSISFKVKKAFKESEISFNEVTYLSSDLENYLSLGYGDFIPDEKYTFRFKYDSGSSYIDPTPAPETGDSVSNLYKDDKYTTPVRTDSINIYANGGTVTKNNVKQTFAESCVKTNYKAYSLYTDILASYRYWTDAKGRYQTATGKVIVGITKTDQKDQLVFSKKGAIVDAEAAKIASASIKNGRITVTAKSQAGTVYLWVMDTGDAGKYTCCPVTVKMAPTNLYTYQTSNVQYGKTAKYTKASIDVSDTTDVYVYPTYKENKEVKKTSDATYTAVVENKVKDYFIVTKSAAEPEKFTIKATGLKDNKTVSGKITIQCDQNGKKVNFTATAVNGVKKVELANSSGMTLDSSTGQIKLTSSKTAKTSGTVGLQLEKASSSYEATDTPKVYAMGTAEGYDMTKFATGTVSIKNKPSTAQKKITVSINSDKKSLTISAAKGASAGITTYFLLVYNTSDTADKKGYQVFSVTTE